MTEMHVIEVLGGRIIRVDGRHRGAICLLSFRMTSIDHCD